MLDANEFIHMIGIVPWVCSGLRLCVFMISTQVCNSILEQHFHCRNTSIFLASIKDSICSSSHLTLCSEGHATPQEWGRGGPSYLFFTIFSSSFSSTFFHRFRSILISSGSSSILVSQRGIPHFIPKHQHIKNINLESSTSSQSISTSKYEIKIELKHF